MNNNNKHQPFELTSKIRTKPPDEQPKPNSFHSDRLDADYRSWIHAKHASMHAVMKALSQQALLYIRTLTTNQPSKRLPIHYDE